MADVIVGRVGYIHIIDEITKEILFFFHCYSCFSIFFITFAAMEKHDQTKKDEYFMRKALAEAQEA